MQRVEDHMAQGKTLRAAFAAALPKLPRPDAAPIVDWILELDKECARDQEGNTLGTDRLAVLAAEGVEDPEDLRLCRRLLTAANDARREWLAQRRSKARRPAGGAGS